MYRALSLLSCTAALVLGCSSEGSEGGGGGGGACAAYVAPAGTDLTSQVSFKAEVMPILQASCALSASCHAGSRPPVLGGEAAAVRAGLIDKPAAKLASMAFVTPGRPDRSYLLRKMDGDQCVFDKECAGNGCGAPMPLDSPPLPVAQRDAVRRWIAQGAPDN